MTIDYIALTLALVSFAVLIAIRVPITFSLIISSVITTIYLGLPLESVVQNIMQGINNFSLLAIPFFILMGEIMGYGGITQKLIDFSNVAVGRIRGGLAQVNVLASMFFGGVSGSAVADVSTIGAMLIPIMKKKGYDSDFAVAVTVSSACQGIIIPPSHNMIIYTIAAANITYLGKALPTATVGNMFMGGYLPGIMLGVILMGICYIIARVRGYPKERKYSFKEGLKISIDAFLGVVTAVIIVFGIYFGVFTATEASTVAVAYSLFVAFVFYRLPAKKSFAIVGIITAFFILLWVIGLVFSPYYDSRVIFRIKEIVSWIFAFAMLGFLYKQLKEKVKLSEISGIVVSTLKTLALVISVIMAAKAYSHVLTLLKLPTITTEGLLSITDNPILLILLINLLIILLGCIMDMAPLIMILTPILYPVVVGKLGMSPIQFGIMLLLNLGIGLCTPPVGAALFVGCSIGKVSIEKATKGLMPFYVAMIISLLLVTFIPDITTFLPDNVAKLKELFS